MKLHVAKRNLQGTLRAVLPKTTQGFLVRRKIAIRRCERLDRQHELGDGNE